MHDDLLLSLRPNLVCFISTKFPTLAESSSTAPFLNLAKGPTSTFFAIEESSIEQKSLIIEFAPIVTFDKTTFDSIQTLLPSFTSPLMVTLLPI